MWHLFHKRVGQQVVQCVYKTVMLEILFVYPDKHFAFTGFKKVSVWFDKFPAKKAYPILKGLTVALTGWLGVSDNC